MPSALSPEFERFITELGIRQEVATALWEADIHTPQELGSLKTEELREITNNPLLVNQFHPILQKHVFNITMAKDPFRKARSVIKKYAPKEEDDNEPVDATAADSVVADARFFTDERTDSGSASTNGNVASTGTARPVQDQSNTRSSQPPRNTSVHDNSTSYNNRGTTMNVEGGRMVQTHVVVQGPGLMSNPFGKSITIAGGNFVQTNLGGQGPVTYNNTDTVITTTDNSDSKDQKTRRSQILNEHVYLDGNRLRVADMRWIDDSNFWVDDIRMRKSNMELYLSHRDSNDVYDVSGDNRALILNNNSFNANTGLDRRIGADRDCRNMRTTLERLGFQVQVAEDKRGSEMRSHLEEFAKSMANMKAGMIVVYIGSHGERDADGNDTFLGCDAERVSFSDVKKMFGPENAPLLMKKPKLFFLQFCRQDNGRTPIPAAAPVFDSVSSDARPTEPTLESERRFAMDILCVYATLAGSKAYRDTGDGSWFVTALIRVLTEHAHNDDLLSMLTKVNNSVSAKEGTEGSETAVQISEVVHNLRKKVFFYPGLVP